MRKGSRKLRAFRPFEGVLEGRNPVSSLVPGISPANATAWQPAMAQSTTSSPPTKIAASVNSSIQPFFVGQPSASTAAVATPAPPVITAWITVTSTAANSSAGPQSVGNLVAFATPYAPSATAVPMVPRAATGSMNSPTAGGVPGGNSSSAPPATPTSTTSANSTSPAPVVIDSGAASTRGSIRPLSLAPTQSSSGVGIVHSMDDSGGSGDDNPPDMPPKLVGSGGNTGATAVLDGNGNPIPGQYYVKNPVPIGTIVSFTAGSPQAGYDITANDWSGGDAYSSYTSGAADAAPSSAQSLGANTSMYTVSYIFIVDQPNGNYTVTDQVSYGNGAHGTSTVTFTSDTPSGSMAPQPTDQGYIYDPVTGNVVMGLSAPMYISASVQTDAFTPGNFMFLQILIRTYSSVTAEGGRALYRKNDIDWTQVPTAPNGQNFNGPLQDGPGTLGQSVTWVSGDGTTVPGGNSWSLGPNSSAYSPAPRMQDLPNVTIAGAAVANDAENQEFSDYLMYQPAGGVWIAIAEVDWHWGATATKTNGAWSPSDIPTDLPIVSTPVGSTAFPTWVNLASNFDSTQANPWRVGNPGPG